MRTVRRFVRTRHPAGAPLPSFHMNHAPQRVETANPEVNAPDDRLPDQRRVHGFARGVHQTVSASMLATGWAVARRAASSTASTMFW